MSELKKTRFTLFLIFVFTIFSNSLMAQVPDEIIQSLKTGNSKTLSEYFNQNIEMVILENDNVYSKAQAQQIVNKFFSSNPPESFNVMHQGGKGGDQYVIGNLVTSKSTFRVTFLLRKNNGKDFIIQLRIEEQ
jgi:hypothetical protein